MKKNLKNYIETLRLNSLDIVEKERVRNELLALTANSQDTILTRAAAHESALGSLRVVYSLFTRPLAVVSAISLFLIITGSTSLAAEKAIPGSALYSMKIHVNEPVRAALSMTSQAKAEWNVDRVERRLQEAEQLSASNSLSERDANTLNELLKISAQKVTTAASSLSTNDHNADSVKILSSLESTLKAHSEILLQMGESNNQNVKKNVSRILDNTLTVAQETEDLRSHAEDTVHTQNEGDIESQAQNAIQAAQDTLIAVQKLLDANRSLLTSTTATRIELSIKASKDALANSDSSIHAKLFSQAFASAQQAHRLALEAQTLIASIKRLSPKKTQTRQQQTIEASAPDITGTTVQFRLDEELGGRLEQLRNGNGKLRDSAEVSPLDENSASAHGSRASKVDWYKQ